jgi:uncharacterized protein (TIGR02996 family)
VTIILTIVVMLAIPIGILIYEEVRAPSGYEQLEAMLRDPTQRARAKRIIRGPRKNPRVPRPREPMPVVANDRSEESLLDELQHDPGDEGARMVYADWLEQRGEDSKAAIVRGERVERSELLRTELPWRAVCTDPVVPAHDCETMHWSMLRPTDNDPFLRECPRCDEAVRFCANADEQRVAEARDELALLDPAAWP